MAIMLTFPLLSLAQSRNVCDNYMEAGMADSIIERCHQQHGQSDWYQQEIQRRQQQATHREQMQNAIERQTFSREELRNELGFGELDLIAYRTDIIYGAGHRIRDQRRSQVSSPDAVCEALGHDKAARVIIDSNEIDGQEISGQAHSISVQVERRFLRRNNESTEMVPWIWQHRNDRARVVQLFHEIECVSSEMENNELFEAIRMVEQLRDVSREVTQATQAPQVSQETGEVDSEVQRSPAVSNVPRNDPYEAFFGFSSDNNSYMAPRRADER